MRSSGFEREWDLLRLPGAGAIRARASPFGVRRDEHGEQPRDGLRAGRLLGHGAGVARAASPANRRSRADHRGEAPRHAGRVPRVLGLPLDEPDRGSAARARAGPSRAVACRRDRRADARRWRGRRPDARSARRGDRVRREPGEDPRVRSHGDRRGSRPRPGLRAARGAWGGALPPAPDRLLARELRLRRRLRLGLGGVAERDARGPDRRAGARPHRSLEVAAARRARHAGAGPGTCSLRLVRDLSRADFGAGAWPIRSNGRLRAGL